MNRQRIIQVAYQAVLAMDDKRPTRRAVQEMCQKICGKALQSSDIAAFLREPYWVPFENGASDGSVKP